MAILPRPAAWAHRQTPPSDAPAIGIALLLIAALLIPISDGFAKTLAADLSPVQIVWLRYAVQTVMVLPVVIWWHRRRVFRVAHPLTQILRSLLITASAFCFFSALRTVPLADAVAVFFINPFIVTALSPFVLGERVGIWRWSAVAAGFIGTLIIIQPGFETIDDGIFYAIGAGTCFSLFVLVTRRLAGGDPPLVTTFVTGLGALILATPVVPFVWVEVNQTHLALVAGMGVLGFVFSLLVVLAYERASASQLAPFGYAEIAAAA